MKHNVLKLIIAVTVLTVIGAGCARGGGLAKNEVARVNGTPITRSQLSTYVLQLAAQNNQADQPQGEQAQNLEQAALYDLIWQELLTQQAEKRGLKVDDAEVDTSLNQIKAQDFGGDEQQLNEALKNQGLTLKEAREYLRKSLLVEKLNQQITGEVTKISDQEIEEYYQENEAALKEPEKRHLRHMLFTTGEEALKAKARLEAGTDFGALAKEVSLDINTNEQGGDLGWIARGITAPAFEAVAFKLAAGAWSDPVLTPSGWNIIKVEEIKPAGQPTLEEAKDKIRSLLLAERSDQAMSTWLGRVVKEADIQLADEFQGLKINAPPQAGLPADHPEM